jgi:hypothetical protein
MAVQKFNLFLAEYASSVPLCRKARKPGAETPWPISSGCECVRPRSKRAGFSRQVFAFWPL